MFICIFWVHLLTMDQFVTSTCVGLSRASSSKRKAPDHAPLEHYEVIENLGWIVMCVKCVRCWGVLKANAEKLVCILHTFRAIHKIDNVDLNAKYLVGVEAMLVEQHCIDHESESECFNLQAEVNVNLELIIWVVIVVLCLQLVQLNWRLMACRLFIMNDLCAFFGAYHLARYTWVLSHPSIVKYPS